MSMNKKTHFTVAVHRSKNHKFRGMGGDGGGGGGGQEGGRVGGGGGGARHVNTSKNAV